MGGRGGKKGFTSQDHLLFKPPVHASHSHLVFTPCIHSRSLPWRAGAAARRSARRIAHSHTPFTPPPPIHTASDTVCLLNLRSCVQVEATAQMGGRGGKKGFTSQDHLLFKPPVHASHAHLVFTPCIHSRSLLQRAVASARRRERSRAHSHFPVNTSTSHSHRIRHDISIELNLRFVYRSRLHRSHLVVTSSHRAFTAGRCSSGRPRRQEEAQEAERRGVVRRGRWLRDARRRHLAGDSQILNNRCPMLDCFLTILKQMR